MSKTVTTRLDDDSVMRIDELAAKKGVDRAAMLRSFLKYALSDYLLRDCMEEYEAGKITLWEAAQKCDLSLWEIIRKIKQTHVHVSYDLEALRKDMMEIDSDNR